MMDKLQTLPLREDIDFSCKTCGMELLYVGSKDKYEFGVCVYKDCEEYEEQE